MPMLARALTIAVVVAQLAACKSKGPAPAAAPPPELTAERLDDLTSLAIGRTLEPARRAETLARLKAGSLTIDALIDELLRDPSFARETVPHLLLGWLDFGPYSFIIYPLYKEEIDGVPVYYQARVAGARRKCKLSETIDVHPWWDLASTVKVCPADHQPTALTTKDGNVCSGITAGGAGDFACGCGPNLINCTNDPVAMQRSFHQETVRTIAYVVENDMPVKELFTTPYSFRDRNVAYAYERDRVYQGKLREVPDLGAWPTEGKWAPREEDWPGAHAGILTNRQLLYMTDGPRDRMRLFYDRFWCKVPTSFGVEIEVFRKLVHGTADLRNRGAGWQQLAAQPGCTECHARMDYGMQFFAGYPSAFTAVTGTPQTSRHAERGPLYGDDIEDKRGEAQLTPRAFGEHLVSQPEFADCMVEHVERHVLGTATPDERAELQRAFATTERLTPVFAIALRQFAARTTSPAKRYEAPPAVAPAHRARPDGTLALGDRLVRILDEQCGHCHDDAGDPLGIFADLEARRALPRDQLLSIGNVVASGLMPKNEPITPAARRELLQELVRALAPDPAWAREALAYWHGDMFHPSRIQHIGALRRRMLAEAPGAQDDTNVRSLVDHSLERDLLDLTPAAVMEIGKLSVKMCAHVDEAQRFDCYLRLTRPDVARVE